MGRAMRGHAGAQPGAVQAGRHQRPEPFPPHAWYVMQHTHARCIHIHLRRLRLLSPRPFVLAARVKAHPDSACPLSVVFILIGTLPGVERIKGFRYPAPG